ncbi:MAG: response regulator [Rickettsiales bacterium]|nr:response regulator [Rickettsiales bacterium]
MTEQQEQNKIKILCVEDEQEIRENIAEILRDEGYEVFEAENGKVGFNIFTKNRPDLVISDIMMPEVDGYALLKMIREGKNIKNNLVPFIFLTALGQKDNVIKGVNLSANDYLVKPIDFDLMIAKIKEKTANAAKLQDFHNRNIKNIKHQVSTVLPNELFSYLDVITQVSKMLKDEPYGALPHRRYLDDINKIYLNALKLKSSITNSLDENVIDNKLDVEEEIFDMTEFLDGFIATLSDKFKSKIKFDHPFESELLPRVKFDKVIFHDALKKILSGIFKADINAEINITIMIDHFDQMAIIFYLNTNLADANIASKLDEQHVKSVLDKQSCLFEVSEGKEKNAVLFIPSFRLVTRS